MTSGNQTCRNAHKKRSGASGEHPASRSAPRCPLRGVPGRRVLSIRACLRPGNALTPRRKCSNRAASNFNSRSPAHGFDVMFPISSAMQCGDEKNTQKTAVCRARSTHHTAAKLGQPIKKEKNRGITLSLSLSLSAGNSARRLDAPRRYEEKIWLRISSFHTAFCKKILRCRPLPGGAGNHLRPFKPLPGGRNGHKTLCICLSEN